MHIRPVQAALSPRPPATRQSGFTLIEILVAILVLSFGMLGVVGLQAAALQANKEARYQSSAVRLSRDLSDMMRGNFILARTPGNPYLAASTLTEASPPPTSPQNCYTSVCTPNQLGVFQMNEWFARAKTELPGIKVMVCLDTQPYDAGGMPVWACSSSGDVPVIKIGWNRASLDKAADGSSVAPIDAATRPAIVTPVIPG